MTSVGVIGLGFMGRTHLAAYQAARDDGYACRVAAVCDRDGARLSNLATAPRGNLPAARDNDAGQRAEPDGLAGVRRLTDLNDLLADDDIDLVSICTPTDSHVTLTLAALRAGRHVLVEKPLALDVNEITAVAKATETSGRVCMPAMCMRFWPGWSWLKQRVEDGAYGAVRSAVFQRLGAMPDWSRAFYADETRSGGALVDLHIHDADFVRWCFGDPRAVSSTGSPDHLTTLYHFAEGPEHVVAEGGWSHAAGFGFRMRYVVAFENATADFDLSRDEPLLLSRGTECKPVALEARTGYDMEIRHMLGVVRGEEPGPRATVEDALAVARLLDAERRSLASGNRISIER